MLEFAEIIGIFTAFFVLILLMLLFTVFFIGLMKLIAYFID